MNFMCNVESHLFELFWVNNGPWYIWFASEPRWKFTAKIGTISLWNTIKFSCNSEFTVSRSCLGIILFLFRSLSNELLWFCTCIYAHPRLRDTCISLFKCIKFWIAWLLNYFCQVDLRLLFYFYLFNIDVSNGYELILYSLRLHSVKFVCNFLVVIL